MKTSVEPAKLAAPVSSTLTEEPAMLVLLLTSKVALALRSDDGWRSPQADPTGVVGLTDAMMNASPGTLASALLAVLEDPPATLARVPLAVFK